MSPRGLNGVLFMNEVEVKILEINRKEVEAKLIAIGAKKTFEGEMIAQYYEKGNIRNEGIIIRIRKEGTKTIFAIKKKISNEKTKITDEREVEVNDFEKMNKILELLGYKVFLKIRKHRTQYEVGKVHFTLDKYFDDWGFIPEFLEIESDNEEDVFSYAKKLGLKKDDCKAWGGWTLHDYYAKNI